MMTWNKFRSVVALLFLATLLSPTIGNGAWLPGDTLIAAAPGECDELDAYMNKIEAKIQDLGDEYSEGPGLFGGGQDVTVFNATPDEFLAAAEVLDQIAKDIGKIDPPEIAREYHRQLVLSVRMLANVMRDASNMGFMSAMMAYSLMSGADDSTKDTEELAAEIDAQCPGFAKWNEEAGNVIATPTSGT